MEFAPGAPRLDDIVGGTLLAGTVPLSRLRRTEVSAENAAAVAVTAAQVNIASVDLGTVVAGDRIIVTVRVAITKGVTAGDTRYFVGKFAGTATIQVANDESDLQYHEDEQPASTSFIISFTGAIKVIAGGTLTLGLNGASAGSNGTVPIGGGQLHALVLSGS